MREIKFRCKVKGDGGIWNVWVIDWLKQRVMLDGAREKEWLDMKKVQHLMQFTGLKDKNGKEIYEGDIVRFQRHSAAQLSAFKVGEVRYNESHARFQFVWFNNELERKRNHPSIAGMDVPPTLEIIGNIYENPELLTK